VLKLVAKNEAETLAVGRALAAVVRPGDIVAIDGPLGAGKTRLVRGLAMGMGFEGNVVSSPTYVVVNEYVLGEGESRLFHADAYRLSGPDDLDSLGWERVVDGSGVVAVEWAERVAAALGTGAEGEPPLWRVRMEPVGGLEETRRVIEVEPAAGWRGREGAAELDRLAALLREGAKHEGLPLPRGWARCATTGKPVPPDSATFPFADERARLADLGRWMSGAYVLGRELTEEDQVDPPGGGVPGRAPD
jgi:tRNA threonylcarbamoyladenosine biosynthesis protein TsaE